MKTPKPRRLPSGSWFIQLRLGGESIPVTAGTEREATRQAALIKAEYQAGKRAAAASPRTLEQAMTAYIDSRANVLSPSTVHGYRTIIKTRFLAWSSRPVSRIDFQKMVNEEAKLCGPKTLRNAFGLVAAAVEAEGLPRPAVSLPQLGKADHAFLQPEQIQVLVREIRENVHELPILLGLHGLRRSEIFGLRWADIDTKCGLIHVRGAAVLGEDGMVHKKSNKNASSRRDVPILIPRLSELADARKRASKPEEYIYTSNPNNLYATVNAACRRASLPEVGVHGLRHSFASLCYHLGVNELTCMQLGGWSDYNTMRKIYTHLSESDRASQTAALTAFFQTSDGASSQLNANKNANESRKH